MKDYMQKTLVKYIIIAAVVIIGLLPFAAFKHAPSYIEVPTRAELPQVQAGPTIAASIQKPKKYRLITLSKKNTLTLREEVTEKSMSALQLKALALSQTLSSSEPIILVMNTPGGEVEAGLHFIDAIKGLPQKVNTLSLFAASMGFHIAQALNTRYITPSGVLMSHRMSVGGVGGEVPGRAIVEMNAVLSLAVSLDKTSSARMGMNIGDYEQMVRDEFWVRGEEAIETNAADEVVIARCASDLQGQYDAEYDVSFGGLALGKIKVTWSECPLVMYPIASNTESFIKSTLSERPELIPQRDYLANYLNAMFFNRTQFVQAYGDANSKVKVVRVR